jgi:hypothetical protein
MSDDKEPLNIALVRHDTETPKILLEKFKSAVDQFQITSMIIIGIGPGQVMHAQVANLYEDPIRLIGALEVARIDVATKLMEEQ